MVRILQGAPIAFFFFASDPCYHWPVKGLIYASGSQSSPRITESPWLEKVFKVIKTNHQPESPILPQNYAPRCHIHSFQIPLRDGDSTTTLDSPLQRNSRPCELLGEGRCYSDSTAEIGKDMTQPVSPEGITDPPNAFLKRPSNLLKGLSP